MFVYVFLVFGIDGRLYVIHVNSRMLISRKIFGDGLFDIIFIRISQGDYCRGWLCVNQIVIRMVDLLIFTL